MFVRNREDMLPEEAGHLSAEAQKMYMFIHKIFFKLSIVLLVRASFTSTF